MVKIPGDSLKPSLAYMQICTIHTADFVKEKLSEGRMKQLGNFSQFSESIFYNNFMTCPSNAESQNLSLNNQSAHRSSLVTCRYLEARVG